MQEAGKSKENTMFIIKWPTRTTLCKLSGRKTTLTVMHNDYTADYGDNENKWQTYSKVRFLHKYTLSKLVIGNNVVVNSAHNL